MKRLSVVFVSLALLAVAFPMGIFAQQFPDIPGDVFPVDLRSRFSELTFSPDGNWYAYYYTQGIFQDAVTYLVPVNGGQVKVLMDFGNDTFESSDDDIVINGYRSTGTRHGLDFSPDGSKLVASVALYDTTKGSLWIEYNESRQLSREVETVVTIDIITGEIEYIADGMNPRWSADGRYIVYNNVDYRMKTDFENAEHIYELTKYDTVTGDFEFIEPCPGEPSPKRVMDFDIGPDNYVYFAPTFLNEARTSVDFKIKRMPIDGGEIEEVTGFYNRSTCRKIQVSSDGKWILFSDNEDVLVANIATGEIFNVFTGEQQYERRSESFGEYTYMRVFLNPFFFENGTRICYSTLTVDGDGMGQTAHSDMLPEQQALDGTYIIDFDPANYIAGGDDIISAVEDLPEAFLTLGAFPNPFNPSTTLQFTLPEAGHAELTVFNFAGQKVRTLAEGEFSAGAHNIVWDGCNANGIPVSSGVYLSRLKSRDNVVTSRMTLVK